MGRPREYNKVAEEPEPSISTNAANVILDGRNCRSNLKEIRGNTMTFQDWGDNYLITEEVVPEHIDTLILINCRWRLMLPSQLRSLYWTTRPEYSPQPETLPYLIPPKKKQDYDPRTNTYTLYTTRRKQFPSSMQSLTLRHYGARRLYSSKQLYAIENLTLIDCPGMEKELVAHRRKMARIQRTLSFAVTRAKKVPDADNMACIIASFL